MNRKLTNKQVMFCEEYLKGISAEKSALSAGYSVSYSKANSYRLLEHVGVKKYLKDRTNNAKNKMIMKTDEILEMFSKVARGEITDEKAFAGQNGIEVVELRVKIADRIKAGEHLLKVSGAYNKKDIENNGNSISSLVSKYG